MANSHNIAFIEKTIEKYCNRKLRFVQSWFLFWQNDKHSEIFRSTFPCINWYSYRVKKTSPVGKLTRMYRMKACCMTINYNSFLFCMFEYMCTKIRANNKLQNYSIAYNWRIVWSIWYLCDFFDVECAEKVVHLDFVKFKIITEKGMRYVLKSCFYQKLPTEKWMKNQKKIWIYFRWNENKIFFW